MTADLDIIGPPKPAWMARGACVDKDANIFFPARGEEATEAKAICANCPVLDTCRDWILHQVGQWTHHGIWGGLSREERRRVRRDLGLVASRTRVGPQPLDDNGQRDRCGTMSGYEMHRRYGESPCVDCRKADSAERKIRKSRRRAALRLVG